jgi:hypothetical protein
LSPARAARVHIWKRPSLIPGLGEIFGDPTQLDLVRHLEANLRERRRSGAVVNAVAAVRFSLALGASCD